MTREEAKRRIEFCRNFLANNYSDMGEPDFTAFNMAIKALEQEPGEDAVGRQAVNTLVDELARAISDERCFMSRGRSTATIMQDILDLPPVNPLSKDYNTIYYTPQPKTGHWIDNPNAYECSECGIIRAKGTTGKYNYCPSCGTKMIEPQERNEKG